jgi:hypothetical protein
MQSTKSPLASAKIIFSWDRLWGMQIAIVIFIGSLIKIAQRLREHCSTKNWAITETATQGKICS